MAHLELAQIGGVGSTGSNAGTGPGDHGGVTLCDHRGLCAPLPSWRLYVQGPVEGHTVRDRLSAGMVLAEYPDWDEWLDLAHSP